MDLSTFLPIARGDEPADLVLRNGRVINVFTGEIIETAGCHTGFRKIEIKDKQVLINGKPIIIRGTNLHEHHEKYGHYVDPETRLKDIQLMKLNNLNAIRTSHYPQDPLFYEN